MSQREERRELREDAYDERPEVGRGRRGSSSSTTVASSSHTLIDHSSASLPHPSVGLAPASIKIIDVQKTSNSQPESRQVDQEQRRGFRNSYNPSPKQQVAQASGVRYPASQIQRSNGSRSAQPPEQQPLQQQSGETLSSFESDYDLLLYIGETETEDIVDTERSLDYQDQTWRASVCGGASLAPTIDGSLSELLGGSQAGGLTPEFDLLEYDSKRDTRPQPVSREPTLGLPNSLPQSRRTGLNDNNRLVDDCDREVSRVFSSLMTQLPTAATLDRHRLAAGRRDMDQQRSQTLDRSRGHQQQQQPQVSNTEDLDKLLAEMSNSIDLNALARYDSTAGSQRATSGGAPPVSASSAHPAMPTVTNSSSRATTNVEASSESILEELDGASRMLEQMIAEQFPNRQHHTTNRTSQLKTNQESTSPGQESPGSIISRGQYRVPPTSSTGGTSPPTKDMTTAQPIEPKKSTIPGEKVNLIPIKVEQQEAAAGISIWKPRRSSLKVTRPREEPPPPPPLPERDYDTVSQHSGYVPGNNNIVLLEPDRYGEEVEKERSHVNKMKQRTMSGVRRMRDKIGDFIGQTSADAANERQSRSLTRRTNQVPDEEPSTLGTQIRDRLSRSRSRVSRWWQRGTRWSKRAQSTPNTKTSAEEDSELFQPSDIARMSGRESPARLEPVRDSLRGSISSSSSEPTHLSGLEPTSARPTRSSLGRGNKSVADGSGKQQRERATSLLSLKRLSSSLRSPTPAPKEDLDSIQVNVRPKAAERKRRRKRKANGGRTVSECSSGGGGGGGGQSDTIGLIQVSERPPETQEYFSRLQAAAPSSISSKASSSNHKPPLKSQSLRSVRQCRAPSLTSLGHQARASDKLAPTTNTFRPKSAQAATEQERPVSVVSRGAESTRAQTITPVGPTGRSESTDPRYELTNLGNPPQPVSRTKSTSMLSEFKQKCSNLLRVGRPRDTVSQPKRPPRRSKSVGPVQLKQEQEHQQTDHRLAPATTQQLEPQPESNHLWKPWKPVIETSGGLSASRRTSKQLESSEALSNQQRRPTETEPGLSPVIDSDGVLTGVLTAAAAAKRLSLDTESTWESSTEQEAEPGDSSSKPFPQPDVSGLELEPLADKLVGAEPARAAKTTATSSSPTSTTTTEPDRLVARAPAQALGGEPGELNNVKQVPLSRQQQQQQVTVSAICPELAQLPPPPPPPASKPTPPPRLLAAPTRLQKTCLESKGNNMEQGPSVGTGQQHLEDAPIQSESADLWRFKFSKDLPEPRIPASSPDAQVSAKANQEPKTSKQEREEEEERDDEEDEKRFSIYENVPQQDAGFKREGSRKLPSWPPTPEPADNADSVEPPKPPRLSLAANKPPKPERKLIKMLSIIHDPNDDLMVARGSGASSGFTASPSASIGGGARCGSIRSLASVFDETLSNGNLNNYNSDSESSLVAAPKQKLIAKFEQQQAPPQQNQLPKQPPPTTSMRTGAFGGHKAGSRVRRLAKTFDQGCAAPINEEAKPEEEPEQSEALSMASSWHDADQLDEAEVAKFLEELDNSQDSVSTGADPFVTVADSVVGLEGAEETRADTIVSDQEDDNTLNEEQMAEEENPCNPEWQATGDSGSSLMELAAGVSALPRSQTPISSPADCYARPPSPIAATTTTLESEQNKGPDRDQNDNVILIEPSSSTGGTGAPPATSSKCDDNQETKTTTTGALKQPNQEEFKSSLNRLIGRRVSVPLGSGEHPRKHQQQQLSMTTGPSLDVPVGEAGKSKSPSSELRGLSRYYRALLSRRKRQHIKTRDRPVLDDSIQSSSSSSCSVADSSSEGDDDDNDHEGDPKTARFCEKLERMLATKVASNQQQHHQTTRGDDDTNNSLAFSCKDSLSGDEPGSLSSSSAVSYESLPEVRQRQVLQKLYNTVREIHSSEAKFVETLKLLNEDLREHIRGVPSQQSECLSKLLKHLPQLQALNESLLAELATACEQWPHTRKIAHVLVKMGPFLKHYSAYIREFDSVQQQLADCQRKWPLLADRLRSFEATDKCQKLSVQHHLLRPVQRIPQYRLMLQQYLSQLKPDDPDYEDTVSALEVVSRVAEHANQSMSEGINSAKLLALQAKVVGKQRDIVQPGRLFIREGELLKVSRKQPQPRWFVLLSDALLYLTQIQSNDLLYLNNEFPIDDCQVSTPSEQLIGDQFHSEFHVRTSQRSFALIARSRQERDDWVAALRDTADKYLTRRRSLRAASQSSSQASMSLQLESQHPQQTSSMSAGANGDLPAPLQLTTNNCSSSNPAEELLGQRAPLWTPDSRVSMCQLCTSNFSALFRRHHCRACGRVVCSVCSSNRAPLMYLKCRQARVCDHCFHQLKANLHLYYLGADEQRSDASTDPAHLRKLDEHFRTLLKSQFVRGSLLKGRSASKLNNHQSHQELGKLKQLGDNDSGSAISGYLHRRHPTKSKWKRRWFVIQERVLYEYRAIDDVAPMSSLPLLGYQADQPETNVDGLEARSLIRLSHQSTQGGANNNTTDNNKAPSKPVQHLFKAESVGAAERWLDAFSRSLKLEPYKYRSDV